MTNYPKEKPILFPAPDVNAILEGRKTQTRRIVKLKKWMIRDGMNVNTSFIDPGLNYGQYLKVLRGSDETAHRLFCPYGDIGDRLWVRETFSMPRKHSRITLEITDIRVERLKDISEEGSAKESNPLAWVITFKKVEEKL